MSNQSLTQMFIGMNQALMGIGAGPMYPKPLAGRLIAYACLSGTEDVVTNPTLNGAIQVCADMFDIKGSGTPSIEDIAHVRQAMFDLRDKGTACEWWPAFAERYDIPQKMWPFLTENFKAWADVYSGWFANKAPNGQKQARLRGDDEDLEETVHVARARLRGEEPSARLRE